MVESFDYIITVSQLSIFIVDIYSSLEHFLYGFILAIIIGIPIGIITGYYNTLNKIINPLIEIIRPIPPLAWVPFSIIWFKLTNSAASFIIFIGVIFPIIVNTQNSVREVPKIYLESAKVLGCTKNYKIIWYIVIPSIIGRLQSGIKVASGVGWMCLVAAEMFGINGTGLGYKISYYYNLQRIDIVLIYMIMLGLLGLLIDYFIKKSIINFNRD